MPLQAQAIAGPCTSQAQICVGSWSIGFDNVLESAFPLATHVHETYKRITTLDVSRLCGRVEAARPWMNLRSLQESMASASTHSPRRFGSSSAPLCSRVSLPLPTFHLPPPFV